MEQTSKERKSVVVVGRGAIGAIYAAAFSRTQGVDLRVAVDAARAERYRRESFVFNGAPLELNYFTPQPSDAPADLVIIATKWDGFADALRMIEPIVGQRTLILPLLNGILPFEEAVKKYGDNRVMRGYYIGHTASRQENCAHQDGAYKTVVGEAINREGQYSERLISLIEMFDRAGVKYRVDEDMESSRWLKMIINVGLNQTSIIDGGLNYGEIRASKSYQQFCCELMDEGAQIAHHLGIKGAESMSEKAQKLLNTLPDADYSSMAQDVRAGRPTEWAIFGGYLLDIASREKITLAAHQKIKEIIIKQEKRK